MKIKRMQAGGIIYTPFIPNRGTTQQSTSASTSSDGEEKISGTLTKEIVDVLKEQGLTNDVDTFLQQANGFLTKSQSLSNFSPFGGTQEYSMSHLTQVLGMANRVRRNKELYTEATKKLNEQGAWSEAAMDNRGQLYAYTENGIQTVSPTDYYNNQDKYQVLTNGQIMSLRESRPEMAFNEDILQTMSDATSIQTVMDEVRDIIKNFGTTETKGYTAKSGSKIERGFEQLLSGGPDGYYQVSRSNQVNKADANDVQFALTYLYSTLGENAKKLLRAKTAAEGLDPNSNDKLRLLGMALMEHTSDSYDSNFDSAAAKAAFGGDGSDGKTVAISYGEMISTGRGAPLEQFQLYTSNSRHGAMQIKGYDFAAPMDKDSKAIEQSNLQELLDKSVFGTMSNKNGIYYGDQKVDGKDIRKYVWDGTSSLKRVNLPVVEDGNGNYKPAFDAIEQFDKLQQWIDDGTRTEMEIKNEIRKRFGNSVLYSRETGQIQWDLSKTKDFWTVDVYTSTDAVDLDDDSQWITKMDRDKELRDIYQNYANYGQRIPPAGKSRLGHGEVSVGAGSILTAPVFIPVGAATLGTLQYGKPEVPKESVSNIDQRYAAAQRYNQIVRQ